MCGLPVKWGLSGSLGFRWSWMNFSRWMDVVLGGI